jgi:site-specific DNA recombinase
VNATNPSAANHAPRAKRCAIYTRQARTAGGAPAVASIEAQHAACVRYLRRQPAWTVSERRYDDRDRSGANTNRPALQRLLADIAAGQVDVVVVYAVDRLSRWFLDFVTMMERFRDAGVAFVSITQDFSTAEPRGRRTLEMMMSFAGLERAVLGKPPGPAHPSEGSP